VQKRRRGNAGTHQKCRGLPTAVADRRASDQAAWWQRGSERGGGPDEESRGLLIGMEGCWFRERIGELNRPRSPQSAFNAREIFVQRRKTVLVLTARPHRSVRKRGRREYRVGSLVC
jgi:hypothetical protein